MRYLFVLLCAALPFTSHAAPILSEIAWMGTDADANNEWIEIYNFSNTPTDLAGWTLTSGSGLSILLSGTLGPHGVGLLERTDDASVPSIEALAIYTGALPNSGDGDALTLTLRDPNGVVIDEVRGGADWSVIGGSNTVPKKTAQRTMVNSWVTAAPTPGAQNAQKSDPVENTNTNTNTTSNQSGSNTSVPTTVARGEGRAGVRISLTEAVHEMDLDFDIPDIVYVNQPVTFTAHVSGIGPTIKNSLVYTWNFGDVETGLGSEVTHTYTRPGTYAVVVNASYARHDATVRKVIEVKEVLVHIERTSAGDVVLTNLGAYDVDVSGYQLKGTKTFTFPKNTYLLAEGSLVVPQSKVLPDGIGMVALYDLGRNHIAHEGEVVSGAVDPSLVSMRTGSPAPVKRVVARSDSVTLPPSSIVAPREEGEVQGAAIVSQAGLTIPVYAAEEGVAPTQSSHSNKLPYAGLVALIIVGIVLLYRRPHSGDAQ